MKNIGTILGDWLAPIIAWLAVVIMIAAVTAVLLGGR